jgi:hypothetical protein
MDNPIEDARLLNSDCITDACCGLWPQEGVRACPFACASYVEPEVLGPDPAPWTFLILSAVEKSSAVLSL